MNKLKLKKLEHDKPDFGELYEMISDLGDFLNQTPDFNDSEWKANLNIITDFQDDDGSFKLFDTYQIPSDAKIDFCFVPTYISTAALMKAYLAESKAFTPKQKVALYNGLKKSCAKNLKGHGYDALKGQIEAVNIFAKGGLNEFIDLHHDFCGDFSEMIEGIISKFKDKLVQSDFTGPWGESYEEDIKALNAYFSQRLVFVYGTLMKGEANHHYLEKSTYIGKAVIEGYDMYDAGWYPAIIPGDNLIPGELYLVSTDEIPLIDRLECEGRLYKKTCETVAFGGGKTAPALVYVYLRDVSRFERIASWNREYVWYVSYGSNMLTERFACYIGGGSYEGSRYHPPCRDVSYPLAVKAVDIDYDMYFANRSGSWFGGGVSFLDVTGEGSALGVAYLITRQQFEHVVCEENSGRRPHPGYGWYEDIISLGKIDGFEALTVTNAEILPYNEPCEEYLDVLYRGIKENWPEKSDEEIWDYLNGCRR